MERPLDEPHPLTPTPPPLWVDARDSRRPGFSMAVGLTSLWINSQLSVTAFFGGGGRGFDFVVLKHSLDICW